MITFLTSIAILVLGYFIYGTYIEKKFGADSNLKTPAINKEDGIDFIPMKLSKLFLIQFLNIAGLGPIFGAIAGHYGDPLLFYGLFLVLFLPGLFMIIFREYFLYAVEVKVFQKLLETSSEMVLKSLCVFFLLDY